MQTLITSRIGRSLAAASPIFQPELAEPAEPETPETQLALVAKSQDRAAYAQLFRYYGPRLRAYLSRRGLDGATAEELTQEIMLKIWRSAHHYDPAKGSASTWVFTIARNAVSSHFTRGRRPEVEADDPALVCDQPLADDLLAKARARRAVKQALQTLPPKQSAVLEAAYFRGRTLSEVATEQGMPIGTVKTRVRLALARLRRSLPEGAWS